LVCSQYTYLSLGCSRNSEQRMLAFARQQVGKPFSNVGMARSLLFPRQSDNRSFYCAGTVSRASKPHVLFEFLPLCGSHVFTELVAAVLKAGGMLSPDSNPGSATPHSLYKLYSKQAAATANPYTLRQSTKLSLNSVIGQRLPQQVHAQQVPLLGASAGATAHIGGRHGGHGGSQRRRSDSPPRASFRVLSAAPTKPQPGFQHLGLSLTSLRG
jgi:hypothetical protein